MTAFNRAWDMIFKNLPEMPDWFKGTKDQWEHGEELGHECSMCGVRFGNPTEENGSAYVWDASHRDPEEILECEGSGGHSCRWCKWNQERDFINFTRDWQEGME